MDDHRACRDLIFGAWAAAQKLQRSRELSLVLKKLDEAEMWLARVPLGPEQVGPTRLDVPAAGGHHE